MSFQSHNYHFSAVQDNRNQVIFAVWLGFHFFLSTNPHEESIESDLSQEPVALVPGRRITVGKQCLCTQNSSTGQAHNLKIVSSKCMWLSKTWTMPQNSDSVTRDVSQFIRPKTPGSEFNEFGHCSSFANWSLAKRQWWKLSWKLSYKASIESLERAGKTPHNGGGMPGRWWLAWRAGSSKLDVKQKATCRSTDISTENPTNMKSKMSMTVSPIRIAQCNGRGKFLANRRRGSQERFMKGAVSAKHRNSDQSVLIIGQSHKNRLGIS